eukprot:TRINITY_DN22930_c0_g1_i1.p1 TRINITY_DN22930_c0_g1~~TRINITY_DN22930_c0_g1_i1.p1  ORF type:complete len:308 (+),score=111.11 TRINITY_DN22930_c0_g1_i1:58-924(+)
MTEAIDGTFEWLLGAEEAAGWLRSEMPVDGQSSVIVLGSGTSRFSEVLCSEAGCSVTNTDHRRDFCADMRKRSGDGSGQTWVLCDLCQPAPAELAEHSAAHTVAVDKGTVDQVICEGVEAYATLVHNAAVCLRPGGTLAVFTALEDRMLEPFWQPCVVAPVGAGSRRVKRDRRTAAGGQQTITLWLMQRAEAVGPVGEYVRAAREAEEAAGMSAIPPAELAALLDGFDRASEGGLVSVEAAYRIVCPPTSALSEQYSVEDWLQDVAQLRPGCRALAKDDFVECVKELR